MPEKLCTACRQMKPLSEFHRRGGGTHASRCKPCLSEQRKEWRKQSPADPENQAKHKLRWRLGLYGLTPETYDELLAQQNGGCAMCGQVCRTGRRLAVDHDHETGRVRGLLCNGCNRRLGVYESIREQAEEYLSRSPAVTARVVRPLPWSK